MYPDIYPTLPVRLSPDIYPTRELHGYYPDIYPPNTGSREHQNATTRFCSPLPSMKTHSIAVHSSLYSNSM